jgi:hypothetical protein
LGEKRNACRILVAKPEEERDHSVEIGVDRKITLEWMLWKEREKVWN